MSAKEPVVREPFWPEGHPLHADALRAWGEGGYSQQSILSKRFPSSFKCFAQGYVAGREEVAATVAALRKERDEAVALLGELARIYPGTSLQSRIDAALAERGG